MTLPGVPMDHMSVLRLEVENDYAGLPEGANLIPNPSGEQGAWGWTVPSANTELRGTRVGDIWTLQVGNVSIAGAVEFYSEWLGVTAGQWLGLSWDAPAFVGGVGVDDVHRVNIEYKDAAGAALASSPSSTAFTFTAGTRRGLAAHQAPVGAIMARLHFQCYGTAALANPEVGALYQFRNIRLSTGATAASVPITLPWIAPPGWTNILGPTHEIRTGRTPLGANQLAATIIDTALDPATALTLRPGRRIRLHALADTPNLVENPFAAISASNWITAGAVTFSRVATAGHDGSIGFFRLVTIAGYVANTGQAQAGDSANKNIAAGPGDYTGEVWMKGTGDAKLRLYAMTPSAVLLNTTTVVGLTGAWQKVTVTGTAPAGTTGVTIAVVVGTAGAQTVDFDEASITGQNIWSPIFPPATIDTAEVEYDVRAPTGKGTRISLVALDAGAAMANKPRQVAYAAVGWAKNTMEGAGTPWKFNSDTGTGLDAGTAPPSYPTPGTTVLDAIRLTEASAMAAAYVSLDGYVSMYQVGSMDAIPGRTPPKVLSDADFSDISIGFNTADCINHLELTTVATTGVETLTVYTRPLSQQKWGVRKRELKILGLVSDGLIVANQLLSVHSEPLRRPRTMRLPVDTPAKIKAGLGTLELYQKITAQYPAKSINQDVRIIGVSHTINARGWLCELEFAGPSDFPIPSQGS